MSGPRTLLTGLGFGESPRWHDGRLWFANWGTREVVAMDADGSSEVMLHVPTTIPYSVDWLPDGRLLAVSGQEALLLRQEPDGSLVTHADLGALDKVFNELVVDDRGNAYVNGGIIALVTPDGEAATGSPRSTSKRTAAWRTGVSGPTSATVSPTASASTPRAPFGTPTYPTNAA